MQTTHLGRTGLKVSRICLGTMTYGSPAWRDWVLDEAASRPFLKRAVEAGITFFDTADIYSQGASEEVVGRALRDFAGKRESYVLATKVFFPVDGHNGGLSRKHILHAIDGGWAPIMSISPSSTVSTMIPRSRKPSPPCMRSCKAARPAISAPPPCMSGSSPNSWPRRTGWG